jgi:putative FmdB family regulatory protein
MPIYEYRCSNGHQFEVFQAMSDDPVSACTECGAPVERVFHPVAVHFKGSGFYTTDYARKSGGKGSGDGASSDSKDSQGDSKDSKAGDSKGSKDSKGSRDAKSAATSANKDD